jgi:hypothetical protein
MEKWPALSKDFTTMNCPYDAKQSVPHEFTMVACEVSIRAHTSPNIAMDEDDWTEHPTNDEPSMVTLDGPAA